MATLEELRTQRASLEKILSTGAGSVRHGDKSVQYRSTDEIERAISRIDASIAKADGRRRRRVTYLDARRGY